MLSGIGALTVGCRGEAGPFVVDTCFGLTARGVALATRFGPAAFFTVAFDPGLCATFTVFRADELEAARFATVAPSWTAAPFGAAAAAGTMVDERVAGTCVPDAGDGPVSGTMSGPTEGPAVWASAVAPTSRAPATITLAIPLCTALHLPPAGRSPAGSAVRFSARPGPRSA